MRLALLAAVVAACGCTVDGGPIDCPSKERPTARSGVTAVLVPDTNQIYALGGATPTGAVDELWRYSFGTCGGWRRLNTGTSTPGPRAGYAVARDDKRHRIVYIGGDSANDVWALDTDRLTFTKLATVGTPPVPSAAEVAAYDGEHDRVIYAGIETYVLDFSNSDQGNWTFLDATSLSPPATSFIDPTRSLFVVRDAKGLHGFAFLTSTWHDIAEQGDVPSAAAQLVWDDTDRQIVALGDHVATGMMDAAAATAVYTNVATTNDPPPRTDPAVALSGQILWMSGGVTTAGCTLDDLWQLDLSTGAWQNVWPATTCQ